MKSKNSRRFILIHVLQCGCVYMRAYRERGFMCPQFQTGLRFGWQRCCNIHNSLGKCNEVKCHNIPRRSASPQFWQPASTHRCSVSFCVCVCGFNGSILSICLYFMMDGASGWEGDKKSQSKLPRCHLYLLYSNRKSRIDPENCQLL